MCERITVGIVTSLGLVAVNVTLINLREERVAFVICKPLCFQRWVARRQGDRSLTSVPISAVTHRWGLSLDAGLRICPLQATRRPAVGS